MNAFDPTLFMHSLATMMAAAMSPAIAYASMPRALWIRQADEKSAGDPYSVLSSMPGPAMGWEVLPRMGIRCWTVGTSGPAAAARAQKLFETLLGSDGYPLRMQQIAGKLMDGTADGHYRIVSIDFTQRPGDMAPDDRDRANVVFSFDVGFFKEA